MASGASGRVVCPRCGANNFDTQAACWQCGAALSGAAAASAVASAPPLRSSPGAAAAPPPAAAAASFAPSSASDPAIAFWAAIALALFFPFTAIPVGIVFLMLDDRRKAEIGRITLIWGLIFSFLHVLFFVWSLRGTFQAVTTMMQGARMHSALGGAQKDMDGMGGLGSDTLGTGAGGAFGGRARLTTPPQLPPPSASGPVAFPTP